MHTLQCSDRNTIEDIILMFVCFFINTVLKFIIMGLPGEWKEHDSFEERDMNVVEYEAFSLKPHTKGFKA